MQASVMNISRKMLLHSNGRTTSPDISRQRKKFLHGYEIALFIAGSLCRQFLFNFVLTRDDANKIAAFVTVKNKCLKYLLYIFA